ncbi:DUF4197 domain-containing protein [Qipengyuania psychrotolerans]|uniref:DUF4197 domain-containing protein n=1 Tax=Qipengyuania psychrotolerans TaxID=2867238 RepID=A0ABX8ZBD5_9SPHN|nr:DUF4197 domain-containing protein [Qipengyuania psychrotolerans]QZD86282.1 DUF4197 domain-containing protein [Qipengyuania psychrotolerans]
MNDILATTTHRRKFLGGLTLGGAALALPACSTLGGFSLVDAVQRLLFLSSERAFGRMLDDGGFWDQQVAQIGLENLLGARGGLLGNILTSSLFKDRLFDAFGDVAYEGAERAAPVVTDAVRVIGIRNAVALVNGGPTAATGFLRGEMGTRLIDAMVPELGDAMRLAEDPLVGQALAALTGVDIPQVASRVANSIDDTIWREIGVEEAGIRRNPRSTNDPLIIGVFGGANAF